jgi:hypothetical protein
VSGRTKPRQNLDRIFPESAEKGQISQQFCCLLLFPYECIENLDFLQIFTLKWIEKFGHIFNKFAKAREKYYFYKEPNFFFASTDILPSLAGFS